MNLRNQKYENTIYRILELPAVGFPVWPTPLSICRYFVLLGSELFHEY